MKKAFLFLAAAVFILSSCALAHNDKKSSIYVLDWSAEAVYVMDSFLTASPEPLIVTGDGPSDIVADDDFIYVSNSGYGGEASVQKYSSEGDLLCERMTGEMTSPGYIEQDEKRLFLSLWLDNSVLSLFKDSLSEERKISGIPAPQELLYDEGILYAGTNEYSSDASVYMIDTDDWSVSSVEAGMNPSYIDISDDNTLFVSCVGDYNSVNGSVVAIKGDSVIMKRSFGSFLGKIKWTDGFVFVLDAMENCYVLSDEDLSVIETLFVQSPSDIEVFNGKAIIPTNVGKMYVAELSSLTEVTEVEPEPGFKVSELFLK